MSGIGFEFAASVVGLSLLGLWIDRHRGTSPWGLLIGLALGLVGGTYNLIRDSLRATQEVESATSSMSSDQDDRDDREGEDRGSKP